MSYYLAPLANDQQVDANGSPVSGGKLYTYIAGTTTPATTYTDDTGGTPQANPIILNSLGVPASPVWLQGGRTYKLVFQDANGVQTRPTIDDVSGINDPAIASTTDQWVVYAAAPTYISATSFSVTGDQTLLFQVARRLRSVNTGGTVHSTISASSYNAGSGLTTVNVTNDSGALDAGLSQVSYGLLSVTNPSIPRAITVAQINGGPLAGLRNVVINGSMRVDQRNSGASQTFTAAAALAYCVDRWYGYCTGANITGQRIAASGLNRYRFTGAASNAGVGFGQRIEAANSAHLAGATATLSLKAASTSLTSLGWALYYANTADTFGTLASPTRTLIASGTFTINGTEAAYNAQVSIPAAATTGLELVLTGGALLAAQTLTIGDVQIEGGAVATPFERRHYGLELALCQRYHQQSGTVFNGRAYSAGASDVTILPIALPVQMRATPTVAAVSFSNVSNTSSLSLTSATVASVAFRAVSSGAGQAEWTAGYTASAEL